MADSHFSPPVTVRSGEIIKASTFNTNNEAIKTAFNAVGDPLPPTAPSGEKGVNSPFWCLDPTRDEHAVTLGYLNVNFTTSMNASLAKAEQWADEAQDVQVETGQYSAKHWALEASDTYTNLTATLDTAVSDATAKAQQWAEEAEDVEVETGKYSAKHWYLKAESAVVDYINLAGAVSNITYNAYTASKDRQLTYITSSVSVPSDKYVSHYIIDATGGAVTLTLPASPLEGQIVIYQDAKGQFNTNNLTIARNGNNIQGLAEDFTDDRTYGSAYLSYSAANGWIFFNIGYSSEL